MSKKDSARTLIGDSSSHETSGFCVKDARMTGRDLQSHALRRQAGDTQREHGCPGEDYTSHPPLQRDVVRWPRSDQWDVSSRRRRLRGTKTLTVPLPCPPPSSGRGVEVAARHQALRAPPPVSRTREQVPGPRAVGPLPRSDGCAQLSPERKVTPGRLKPVSWGLAPRLDL